MNKKYLLSILLISSLLYGCSSDVNIIPPGHNEELDVILLYGQSNAAGTTPISQLKQYRKKLYRKYSNSNDLTYIRFYADGNASEKFVGTQLGQGHNERYFGPEIGMSEYIEEKVWHQVAIIKSTYGGSLLSTQWLDGKSNRGELYANSIRFTNFALKQLKDMGYKPNIKAICWMQGESDSTGDDWTNNYYNNTKALASYFREDLASYSDSIKFVDAGIADSAYWTNKDAINNAKYQYSLDSELNFYFSTIELGLTVQEKDPAHYNGHSMFTLGYTFASYIYE